MIWSVAIGGLLGLLLGFTDEDDFIMDIILGAIMGFVIWLIAAGVP